VGAPSFPEAHPDAPDLAHAIRIIKEKLAAGASFMITQLFFDNRYYDDFVRRAREAGIDVPIVPGIWPITNVKQIEKVSQLSKADLPERLLAELRAREDSPEAVLDFGVAYATLQCADLLAAGAPGIHFYTLNRSPATRAILSALKLMRPWVARGERLAAGAI